MRRSRIENGTPLCRDWLGTDAKVIRHVRVCGEGHLAIATRIELSRLGIQRDSDYLLPSLRPDLVIACADGEDDQSFAEVAQRAVSEGSPLLFGCLLDRSVRIGPLIDPTGCIALPEPPRPPPHSETWPRAHSSEHTAPDHEPQAAPTHGLHVAEADPPDPPLSLYARLGALLLSAQALSFLLGARKQCVLNRTVELNPWSMESKGYSVLKVRQ